MEPKDIEKRLADLQRQHGELLAILDKCIGGKPQQALRRHAKKHGHTLAEPEPEPEPDK